MDIKTERLHFEDEREYELHLKKHMSGFRIAPAVAADIGELYELQLLAFESEAEMIGSREVPALQESREENATDFANWQVLKMLNEENKIIAAIRYRIDGNIVEVGRVMTHPDYRRQGLAQILLDEVDKAYPDNIKELYTCTKSWTNIRLYEKMGYTNHREVEGGKGLSFVYMRK